MDAQPTLGDPVRDSPVHSLREDGRCSVLSSDEPLAGTASQQRRWVLLEQSGAWGRDVLDGTAFGEELTERLRSHLDEHSARLLLIRRPGRAGQAVARRRVYLVDTGPDRPTLRALDIDAPEDLLDLDLHTGAPLGLRDGFAPTVREIDVPIGLVCTHGKRDQCCALGGRIVASALDARLGAELEAGDVAAGIWECSHTGGHRFAPVLLVMPAGTTYGRGDVDSYAAAVRDARAGRVALSGYRGRSVHSPAAQVAEHAIRHRLGEHGLDALRVGDVSDPAVPERATLEVRHTDGRAWTVELEWRSLPPRPASCGAAPKVAGTWDVAAMEDLAVS